MKDEEEVRNQILEAAKVIIQQYGMVKPTMQDVAKAAGKGKSTLYYYFKSKEEIFEAVISEELNECFLEVKRSVENGVGLEEKLRNYLVAKVAVLKKKQKQYKVLIQSEAHHFDVEHYFALNMAQNDWREKNLIRSLLKSGAEQELLDPALIDGEDGDIIVAIFLTFIKGLEMEVFINKEYKLINEKAKTMTRIVMNGLK